MALGKFDGNLHEVSAQENGNTKIVFKNGKSAVTTRDAVVSTALTALANHLKVSVAFDNNKIVFLSVFTP